MAVSSFTSPLSNALRFLSGLNRNPKGPLQILLKNTKTNLYVAADGWTGDIKKAVDFSTSVEAMDYCLRGLMSDMVVVYSFERVSHNFSVPVDLAILPKNSGGSEGERVQ